MKKLMVFSLVLALVLCGISTVFAEEWKIAFIPKLIGIPYFNAMEKGGLQAEKELGIKFIYTGPTTADSAKQIEMIDNLITQGVDAITVAPNDPVAIAPILKKAREKGIVVLTSDTDGALDVRQAFVNQAKEEDIANTVIDELAKQMNEEGQLAVVSCGPTAWNLNTWILHQNARLSQYPKMELLTVRYAGEDVQNGIRVALDVMSAFPELKGLIGECSTSAPAVAEAIKQAGKIGQVKGIGISVPSMMRPYVKEEVIESFVLWDPVKLGYLTVWAAKELLEGRDFAEWTEVPNVGKVEYVADKKMLVLGPPTVFTKENVDNYDF
ncbi:sugar ABC transporter, sugar-binding protein [Candidatus Vecturithrix granuli]|uniref:Sugar ABC transporter, sugar-binding protein n=1 Tax=Vecturithrix granuli TaxID=1499967 RepID=A0A081C3X2_VECG1|nr:sugar ABC transporter, sugar-binding protein [Candidatus Vecturithrix granuli]